MGRSERGYPCITATDTLGMVLLLVVVGRSGVRNACSQARSRQRRKRKEDVLISMAAWGWLTVVLLVGSIVFVACEGASLGDDERSRAGYLACKCKDSGMGSRQRPRMTRRQR